MAMPSASAMLAAWERGVHQGLAQRGLTLLCLAEPETELRLLAAMSVGDRDRRLLILRENLFGTGMTGLVSCPECREELEIELATTDLRTIVGEETPVLTVRGDTHEIRLRLPDSRDLIAAADRDLEDAARTLLRACVVSATVDGANIEPEALPSHLVALASRHLSDADPLADLRLDLACANCGRHWQKPFDIVPFLWAELEAWAGRMLREIHALASAYGWSEREILSLSPTRRRSYLGMLDA
jgi:hypothetical protein